MKPMRLGPLVSAATLLGIGLGGFFDGILLHQILQWHNMLSAWIPPVDLTSVKVNMFWDGLWGMLYALLEPRLTARLGRLPGGLVLGLASLVTFWFVVLPLKGAGVGGGFDGAEVAIDVAFDLTFGIGTAILFWVGSRIGIGTLPRHSSTLTRSS